MASSIHLSIVIPAYNEADRLPATLGSAIDFLDRDGRSAEIIVVDDGSGDGTSDVVRTAGARDSRIRLIRLPRNRGKGYAVRMGMVNAVGSRVLFADADGATPFQELYRLEAALERGAGVAIGSREGQDNDVRVEARLFRRVVGRIFHTLVGQLTVSGFADTQCGFKLFTAEVAGSLFPRLRMDGFAFDVELLLIAQRDGVSIAEVPINWTHQPGSKVNVVSDGLRMALDLFRIRALAAQGAYAAIRPASLTPVYVERPHTQAPAR